MKSYIKVLKQFSDFKTRTRRKEFWMFTLFSFIISGVLALMDNILGAGGWFSGIYSLLIFVPSTAVYVRRLHDVGKSGWMLLLALIPLIGLIWLLILFCKDSQPRENKWDAKPIENKEDKVWLYFGLGGLFVLPILVVVLPSFSYNDLLIFFPSFLTLVLIFVIVYFIRKSQYKSDVNELDKIKLNKKPEAESEEPSTERNILANRTFQHKNFIGAKTTWKFNEKGNKVTIKAGMFGINTVNTTTSFEDIGERRYKAKGFLGAQIFKLKDDCIITGPVVLNEIF